MTITAKAAANGSTTTPTTTTGASKQVPAPREHGLDRLREEECYHLTNLIRDCLDEAEHLVRKVHAKAYQRTLDHDGSNGTRPLDRAEARQTLTEAYDCAQAGLDYMYRTIAALNDHHDDEEPLTL